MKRVLVLALLAIALISTPAVAKEGLYLGADLAYNNITGSFDWFDTVDSAVGLGLKLGYNFGQFALEGEFIGSSHDDSAFGYNDGDLRGLSVNFKPYFTDPKDQNQFYGLVGLGLFSFEQDTIAGDNIEFTGAGLNLGLGFERFLSNNIALNISGIYRFIRYDEVEQNGVTFDLDDESGDVLSINLGVNFYF